MKLKEIKHPQDSEAWHQWRAEGIGASESAILMGALPFAWNDVLELWKLKTKLKENDFVSNEAMAQGKALEPYARQQYSKVTGIKVQPKCYEHPEYPFLRASLDGINKNSKLIVEIKCPGLGKFKLAKQGVVVDYYYPQMQQQMACTDAEMCHYWVYREDAGGILIKVPRNEAYIQELVRRSEIFWKGVENKTAVLPRHLGINMRGESDPFTINNMESEFVGFYKN